MADGPSFQHPLASGSRAVQSLSSDLSLAWLEDDPLLTGLSDLTGFDFSGLQPELVAASTTHYPVPAGPDATFASSMPGHFAAEYPTDPPQGYLPSRHGLGRSSSVGEYYADDAGNLLPAVTATHGAGPSSGYGASLTMSEGPPVSASTGEAQTNPSPGLRIFHLQRDAGRSTEWRNRVQQVYRIEISQHCLGPLWATWNGQLYINKSTNDHPDALYLRIDAQILESDAIGPSKMCAKCQGKDKPYPRKRCNRVGQDLPQEPNLSRIFCNWPLDPLDKRGSCFEGDISFFIFCHPSHHDRKKLTLQTFRMIATLYKPDNTPLASYALAEEIVSRTTTAKNNSTILSRSVMHNPRSYRATSPEPTTVRFVSDEGDQNNHSDPLESDFYPAPEIVIPQPLSEVVATLSNPASVPRTIPHLFNGVGPDRGCGGDLVKLYGGMFFPTVNYYAKFGELEPTLFYYRNAYLLEGVVPERGEAGHVSVSIVTKEGVALYHERHLFAYIDCGLKDMEKKMGRVYAGSEGALRDVEGALRRFGDSRKGNGTFGESTQAPDTQKRQGGGDKTGAQDEMGQTLNTLEPTSEPTSEWIDVPMQHLKNQNMDARFLPPSRTCTNASAATTTTAVATLWDRTASLKVIKATSRKPTSHSLVSQWLRSGYGSESCRKRKRTPANMGLEGCVGQAGLGGSLVGSINLVLSPEPEKVTEVTCGIDEDLPAILMDVCHSDQPAARASKRRRVETPLQPLVSTYSSPLP